MSKIQVGQRIAYKGDMANSPGYGMVVAVRQQENSGRMFSMSGGGLEPIDDSESYDIVLGDGRKFAAVYGANIGGEFGNKSKRFMLEEGVGSVEEVNAMIAGHAIAQAEALVKKAEKQAAFEKAKEAAKAAGKALGLIPVDEFKASGKRGSAAAWNLRQELKAAGIKCSVKQDGFTSIDVKLADDKDKEAAKVICDKYEAGSFDGMTDCYEYSPNPWGSVFGDVRYVFGRSVEGYSF
jgi:hypothetical protein